MLIEIASHPRLVAAAFRTELPASLEALASPAWLGELLRPDAPAPLQREEAVRAAVRDLLRQGGYKPTGRGKPASEYLVRAAEEGALGSINLVVDVCNAVSLHSGFPISVIDLDRSNAPWRIAIAAAGEKYVFNASGQEIDLEGLLCLYDGSGPCANAVRDSQRTKTSAETQRTLSVVWGCTPFEARVAETVAWYRALLARESARTETVTGR